MQITSKKQLDFFIKADRMINRGYFKIPYRIRIKNMIAGDEIIQYLYYMRCYSYSLHGKDYKHRYGMLGGYLRVSQGYTTDINFIRLDYY